jgi:hypothetical protein
MMTAYQGKCIRLEHASTLEWRYPPIELTAFRTDE